MSSRHDSPEGGRVQLEAERCSPQPQRLLCASIRCKSPERGPSALALRSAQRKAQPPPPLSLPAPQRSTPASPASASEGRWRSDTSPAAQQGLTPCGRARGRGSRGPAAPARWPSKDPPGPMAGGATSPDWCRRSADHCGNLGGGELGRMRSRERGEPEGLGEEASRP